MKIEYFSKGGQYPYQAEGKVEDVFFYLRARHNVISFELFETKESLDEDLEGFYYSAIEADSFITDEEAEEYIKTFWRKYENTMQ